MSAIATVLEAGDFDTALLLLDNLTAVQLSQLSLPSQRSPLHYACQHGRADVAKRLITKYKCSIKSKDHYGSTPLHTAAQYGHLDVVKFLLQSLFSDEASEMLLEIEPGRKLSQVIAEIFQDKISYYTSPKNRKAKTPLDMACVYGRVDIVRFFTEQLGYDPIRCLHLAAYYGHFPLVEYIVEKEGWVIPSKEETTSSQIARWKPPIIELSYSSAAVESWFAVAATAHVEILKYMVEKYHIPVNFIAKFYMGETKYEDEVNEMGDNISFLFFEEPGIDVNVGMSLLHQACRRYLQVVEYLVSLGYDPSLQDVHQVTPLHCSSEAGKLNITKYLMETQGCLPSCDDQGNTPLYLACKNGHLDTVLYLVTCAKCDTSLVNKHGETYLHAASHSGNFEIVNFLADKHDCQIQQDLKGKSPLHCAATSGNLNIVMLLIDMKNCNPNVKDVYGRIPLHCASQKGHLEVVRHFVDKHHCDPLDKDDNDFTPLEWASTNGELEVVRYLATVHQCVARKKCVHCKRSLHLAAQEGHLSIVKFMIEEMKCDPNSRAKWYRTPLHTASIDGHINVIKYLVEAHGCDPAVLDADNNTPMHLACVKDQVNVVKYFIAKLHCFSITEVENVHGLKGRLKPYFYVPKSKISSFLEAVLFKIQVRVFVMGNSGAGKSTLMKALTSPFRVLGRIVKVKGVPPQTAGIIPVTFYSEEYGKVKFYDFAGHEEYYASHEIILQSTTHSLALLTVNISLSMQEVRMQLLYWLLMLLNATAISTSKNQSVNIRVVVIGSHADKVGETKLRDIRQLVMELSGEMNFLYEGFFPCDCRYSISSSMKQLTCKLDNTCKIIRADISVLESELCQMLLDRIDFIMHDNEHPFISISDIHKQNRNIYSSSRKMNSLKNIQVLQDTCVKLHNSGQILLLPDQQNFEESILILKEDKILSQVHGCLQTIKESIRNSSGILNSTQLEKITSAVIKVEEKPAWRREMIDSSVLKYLLFAQFCTAISTSQLMNPPKNLEHTTHYFFPNLVLASRPVDLDTTDGGNYSRFYTWCLKCSSDRHFFTPRYTHTLFIQIVKCEPDAGSTKYVIWKNGILLVHSSGTRSIIEMTNQTTRLCLAMQCVKGHELSLVKRRSWLIQLIKSLACKVCPNVELTESVLQPHTQYPAEKMVEISMKEIAQSIIKGYPFVVVSSTNRSTALQHIELTALVFFDSMCALDASAIKELYSRKDSDALVPPTTLAIVCQSVCLNAELQSVLQTSTRLSYNQLSAEIHKYTIFPEQNLFMLAGIDLPDCIETEQDPCTPDFHSHVSSLPASSLPHLEQQLDWDHEGVEQDLCEIADHLHDWEETLSTHLGLTPIEISDIKEIHFKKPTLQRREALRRWQNKQGLHATYRNLLKLFTDAGHSLGAETVCKVLRTKM